MRIRRIEFGGALVLLLSIQCSPLLVLGWAGESKCGTPSTTAILTQSRLVALDRNKHGWNGVRLTLGPHNKKLQPLTTTKWNWALGTDELGMKRKIVASANQSKMREEEKRETYDDERIPLLNADGENENEEVVKIGLNEELYATDLENKEVLELKIEQQVEKIRSEVAAAAAEYDRLEAAGLVIEDDEGKLLDDPLTKMAIGTNDNEATTTIDEGRIFRFPSMRRVAQLTVLVFVGQILFILWIGCCNIIGMQLLQSIFNSHHIPPT